MGEDVVCVAEALPCAVVTDVNCAHPRDGIGLHQVNFIAPNAANIVRIAVKIVALRLVMALRHGDQVQISVTSAAVAAQVHLEGKRSAAEHYAAGAIVDARVVAGTKRRRVAGAAVRSLEV